jgi:UDP-N-acetylglucosamine acyltransferase
MIHPTAIVHDSALIGEGCHIGPYCVIGEHVRMGKGNRLHAHVIIDGHVAMGDENEIFPFVTIGMRTQDLKWQGGRTLTQMGDRNTIREHVTIHSATADGDTTLIGSDNHLLAYVHIAHDVQLGNHIIMSNLATLAGHIVVEDHVVMGGLAAAHQFCRIGQHAIVGGCSKVVQDVPPLGLERRGFSSENLQALKQAHRILFRSGLNASNAIDKVQAEVASLPVIEQLLDFMRSSQRGVA